MSSGRCNMSKTRESLPTILYVAADGCRHGHRFPSRRPPPALLPPPAAQMPSGGLDGCQAAEDEILFPPMTMLQVLRHKSARRSSEPSYSPREHVRISKLEGRSESSSVLVGPRTAVEDDKLYTIVDVLPCFL